MAYIISFINQKGGVGKTTCVVQIASLLAKSNRKVLVVDLDGQGNATNRILGAYQPDRKHMFDLIIDEEYKENVGKALYPGKDDFKGVYVLAGDKRLATIEPHINNRYGRESILQKILSTIRSKFDFILIDNPPTLNLLTMNALVTSSDNGGYIIPVDMSTDASNGASAVQQTIHLMKKNGMLKEPDFLGVLICQFQKPNANAMRETVNYLTETYGNKLFDFRIPHTSKITEANNHGRSVKSLDSENPASIAYEQLSKLILKKINERAKHV